jgi:hypothetical protein
MSSAAPIFLRALLVLAPPAGAPAEAAVAAVLDD